MELKDTVSEKAGDYFRRMHPIVTSNVSPTDKTSLVLIEGFNNERDSLIKMMEGQPKSPLKFKLTSRLDRIDQLIEKLKTT